MLIHYIRGDEVDVHSVSYYLYCPSAPVLRMLRDSDISIFACAMGHAGSNISFQQAYHPHVF